MMMMMMKVAVENGITLDKGISLNDYEECTVLKYMLQCSPVEV
jgi:hypothetical protein